jgi:ATP-binding cassette subfamily C protein
VRFSLKAGDVLGIIGPSGAGKTSLVRSLVGIWRPAKGNVRLDGAALDQWMPEALGKHVGYLPQNVELLAGSVAQNIARFEREPVRRKSPSTCGFTAPGVKCHLMLDGSYPADA